MAKKSTSAVVYIFKVALKGNKNIWRRIAIRGHQTLDDLHEAIFDAFDRYDEHLYSFYVAPLGTRDRDRVRTGVVYSHPAAVEESGDWDDDEEEEHDASRTRIDSLGLQPKQVIEYLFDFGDEWWHVLTVEKTDAVAEGEYPRVLEKKGESPPQYPDLDDDGEDDEP